MIETDVIAYIQIIKGKISADMDKLSKLLWDNYDKKLSKTVSSIRYEDSYCPSDPIVDEIIVEMQDNFQEITGERICNTSYWGHIHEKNMSTNMHNHNTTYVSSVVYVEVPEGSGSIVFRPRFNQYDNSAYSSRFAPERGVYYIFPGYLDHFVTRNLSDRFRVSLSINFKKDE